MFLALDEGLGIELQQFAQRAQEFRGAVQADGRLQIGPIKLLAEQAAEFAVHADVDIGVRQARYVSQMAAQRKDHVDLGAHAFHQPADFREIGGHVEHAIAGPDDVHARLGAGGAGLALEGGAFLRAIFGPQPAHGAVGALPLIFIDGARQEALDARALRRHAAADHLRDGAGDDDARQIRIKGRMGALHGAFGAVAAEFFFGQTCHHDGQFMGRQTIGVMQHRGHRQVFTAHGAIDDHLQSLDRGEDIDGAPIAARAVVIED